MQRLGHVICQTGHVRSERTDVFRERSERIEWGESSEVSPFSDVLKRSVITTVSVSQRLKHFCPQVIEDGDNTSILL